MRIADILYFAPGIKFAELDLSGQILPEQFEKRMKGFYLEPAAAMIRNGHAFACGLLLVSCIDALARLHLSTGVGDRFRSWVKAQLQSFASNDIAHRFYDEFRNGLVHEGRIKNGGQFALDQPETVVIVSRCLSINPKYLADEVNDALHRYVAELKGNTNTRNELLDRIKTDFRHELEG